MTNVNIQYDNALLGILQNEGKLENFLDVIFGFLMRRTDFFYIMTPEQKKIGFPPGVSIEMILKAYEKYKTIFEGYQRHRQVDTNQSVKIVESVIKEEPKQPNITVLPSNEDKNVSGCPSSVKNLTSKSEENDELKVYQADPDCYNGAIRDSYTWSQTIKDIDIKIKIPENVDARNVSVNIERKHIHVSVQKDKKEIFCFDGDLCWEIHKNDAIWTFHSKENQIQLCLDKIQERWWEAAFDGEDKLNTRKIDCSRPMHELDDEAQAKIQQLMYDEQRKRQGLPTIEQEKMQNILAHAWNKEGSPFKGTPYDPSQVKLEGTSMDIQTQPM
ncbi:nuclear movement protein related [Schistosoma mansoni]|uniref:nuclear movement protein related n=1 Tax=Schistosoma mansoni TaxID=6183 RepID=UPI0001A645BB|nr:nuclear movement protein related [Schistosoma mansoni]|eukprot:XP_018654372.1 nuclear movement protein related [Schistosoma mansoni]